MPAHHARMRIVLVLPVNGLDYGGVGRAQGKEDVYFSDDGILFDLESALAGARRQGKTRICFHLIY